MTRDEIAEALRVLNEDQLKQRAIMSSSDAHASKAIKLGQDFETEYPEEYAAYVAANAKFHENAERIEELEAMVPEEEPHHDYPEAEE